MNSCRTLAFINIPELGEFSEHEICYNETISQLIEKILQSYQQAFSDSFRLYIADKMYTELNPRSKCSIMIGIKSNQLILTKTQYRNITIYFENHRFVVPYDISSRVIDFIDNVLHILIAESVLQPKDLKETFVLFDPKSDTILFADKNLNENSDFYILKRFEFIAPGVTFEVHKENPVFAKSKITDCSLEQNIMSQLIRRFRSFHKMLNLNEIQFKRLTDQSIQAIYNDLKDGKYHTSSYSFSEQLNFIFSLFSLVKRPFIPSSLIELIRQAVHTNNDIERFEILQVFGLYLPLSTILVLEEILQLFSTTTVDADSWQVIPSMIDQLLFNSVSDEQNDESVHPLDIEERKIFSSFFFLFLKQILFIKEKVGWKSSIKILKSQMQHKSHDKKRHHKHHKRKKGASKTNGINKQPKKSHHAKDDDNDSENEKGGAIRQHTEKKAIPHESSDDNLVKLQKTKNQDFDSTDSDGVPTDDSDNISASDPETLHLGKEKKPIQFVLFQEYNTEWILRKVDQICDPNLDLYDDFIPAYRIETVNVLLDKYLEEKSKETQQQVGEDIQNLNSLLNDLNTMFNLSLSEIQSNSSSSND